MTPAAARVLAVVLPLVLAGCGPAAPDDPASPVPGATPSEQPAPSGAGDVDDTSPLPEPGKDLITDPAY